MEDRKIIYTISKNHVWLEVLYKNTSMNCKSVYAGKNRKDCERWIKENVKEN